MRNKKPQHFAAAIAIKNDEIRNTLCLIPLLIRLNIHFTKGISQRLQLVA
jgi:hypothetical protein